MGKIGLVTVLYNSDAMLPGFFASLALQDYKDFILYLIDNSPSVKTREVVRACGEAHKLLTIRHIESAGNIGVAAGNNAGIQASIKDGCSHILLLNNDIEFHQPNILSGMLAIVSDSSIDMAVPKIFYHGSRKLWMAGGYMDHLRALGVHEGYKKMDADKWNAPHRITYAPTCFMMLRKEVFEAIGMMDERYFAYYDDTDFIYRAIRSGFSLFYDPSYEIVHKVSSSAGENSNFYVYYSNRNKIYFVRKHYNLLHRFLVYGYVFISRFFYWLSFDATRRKSLIKGIRDGFTLPVTD